MENLAQQALERLQIGNKKYTELGTANSDVGEQRRLQLVSAQRPYAVIVGCADSRVVPETIFNEGLGQLFVVRVAGNVVDSSVLGSVEYAVEHLGCKLVVVLGHQHCGAVHAAVSGGASGAIKAITDEILLAVGSQTDEYLACKCNVRHSVEKLAQHIGDNATVVGAYYHLDSGKVDFDL